MVALSFKTDASPYRPLVSAPRSLSTKFIALFAVISLVYFTHSFVPSEYKPDFPSFRLSSSRVRGTCPPRSYAAGEWVPKPPPTNRTDFNASSDVYEFLGFEGCASSREVYWHLAADKPALWDRFPGVSSWKWQPPSDCEVRDLDPAGLVKDLVEQGGWLLIGGEYFPPLRRPNGAFPPTVPIKARCIPRFRAAYRPCPKYASDRDKGQAVKEPLARVSPVALLASVTALLA